MFTVNNVLHTLILDNISTSASGAEVLTDYSLIDDGEVVVTNVSGLILDSTTVVGVDKVVFVQRAGTNLIKSPVIELAKVKKFSSKDYSAATEQVSYIGYNGSSGAIEDITDNTYLVRIHRFDIQKTFGNKEMLKWGVYKTSTTTTQEAVALGLQASLIANFSREPEREIKFELVLSDAASNTDLASLGTPTGDLSVAYGSKIVTFASATTSLTAGDYIRFSASATEALTDPAYEIASVDSATQVTLTVPYQGTSNTAYNDANTHLVPAADVATSDFGIKCTGVARTFEVGKFKYSKVRFAITLQDFGTTTVTDSTSAAEGSGEPEQVAELEWFSQGFEGFIERIGVPAPTPRATVDMADKYKLITIDYKDSSTGSPTFGGYVADSHKQLVIALSGGSNGATFGTAADDVSDGLEPIIEAWGTVTL